MPMNPLMQQNKVTALVTGASSGLGREIAIAFARRNVNVILSGRNMDELIKTQQACIAVNTPPVMTVKVPGDLRHPKTVLDLVNFGALHNCRYLVHCAAVYSRGLVGQTATRAEDIIMPNVVASIDLVQSIYYNVLIRNGGGTICNINSSAGKTGTAGEAYYVASKHAMTGFFKSLRADSRTDQKIRVMDVFLGGTKTPMMADRPDYDYLMEPAEVADVIVTNLSMRPESAQIDEITISRFRFPAQP